MFSLLHTRFGRTALALLLLVSIIPWAASATPSEPTIASPLEPMPPATTSAQAANHTVFLPLVTGPALNLTHEQYQLDLNEPRSVQALNGRVQIDLPASAVAYGYNPFTLHVVSPDPTAAWPEFWLYVSYPTPPPQYYSELLRPITLTLSYAHLPPTFLDEARLSFRSNPSFPWVPNEPLSAQVDPAQTDSIWETRVDPATKQVRLIMNRMSSVVRLDRGYQVSDLAPGPGTSAYALAAPIIYAVAPNGTMSRVADLSTLPAAADLMLASTRFAVDPVRGTIFLGMRSKYVGGAAGIYALNQGNLTQIYTLPSTYGVTALAYRPAGNLLYLGLTYLQSSWFGCSIYNSKVQVLAASSGAEQGTLGLGYGFIRPLSALNVNANGQLLALQPTTGCDASSYDGAHLISAEAATPLARLSQSYPGFRGAAYLASDARGRSYLANTSANLISVVEGIDSRVVGSIAVPAPSALAVVGDTLMVVSQGQIVTRSINDLTTGGFTPQIVETTLAGTRTEVTVRAPSFADPPAHNVLYYNGSRAFMHGDDERAFRSSIGTLRFPIAVGQPKPSAYRPLSNQTAHAEVWINGAQRVSQILAAPAVPYLQWNPSASDQQEVTLPQYGWAMMYVDGNAKLVSDQGLFPPFTARPGGDHVLINVPSLGVSNFIIELEDGTQRNLRANVTPYGPYAADRQTLDPSVGGVLWAGGAAFEIPPSALPARTGGYTVTFQTQQNNLQSVIRDPLSDVSPRYTFQITPEVTLLNHDLLLHLPAPSTNGPPVLAFYDESLSDSVAIPSETHPTTPNYQLLRLPAGSYPLTTAQASLDAESALLGAHQITPQASQGWWRRSLNWLGNTSIWNAVGLPNEKVETDYFAVVYNTRDGVSEAYAQQILDALTTSRSRLIALGFPMPSSQVIVKIAPWATKITESDGFVPGIGTLGNWYMFFNDKLASDELKATAAHEFFHIVQKETSTSARLIAPNWWLEGTAVWAEYAVFPDITSYQERIRTGGDFITKGLRNWNSSTESQYATVAFAIFLEDEYGSGTIKEVFEALGPLTGIEAALKTATGASLADQIERFAWAYFQQQEAPYNEWTIVNALTNYALATAENDLVNTTPPPLSVRLIRATYDPNKSPDAPISFTASSGSVARLLSGCTTMRAWLLNAQRQQIGLAFIGADDPNHGETLERLATYRANNPFYAMVLVGDESTCAVQLRVETPTVTAISPTSVRQGQAATVTIYGRGFGPSEGLRVLAGGGIYTPSAITATSVQFTFPASPAPGSVSVQVQHKSGPISNPQTLTITSP